MFHTALMRISINQLFCNLLFWLFTCTKTRFTQKV